MMYPITERQAKATSGRRTFLVACVLIIVAHVAIQFVVIPAVRISLLHGAYSQDEYADGYDDLANNIVSGHGYRMLPDTAKTMMREPGYPLVLAGLFSLFGPNFAAVKLANMVVTFATAWLIIGITR